jgi:membrane protease YdiL (CAAX protease family)
VFAGVGAVVLGVPAALGYRRTELGLGPGLAVLAGAGFAWLRERTGSLVAPASVHWAVNGTGALLTSAGWGR